MARFHALLRRGKRLSPIISVETADEPLVTFVNTDEGLILYGAGAPCP